MSTESDELVLYADNDEPLYRQSYMPIIENLKKKVAKGKYDPVLATKLWMYHADRAAKKYAKEFATPGEWNRIFSVKDRKEAAAHWEQYARREYLGMTSHDRSRSHARRPAAPKRRKLTTSRSLSKPRVVSTQYEVWTPGDPRADRYSNEAPMFVAVYKDKAQAQAHARRLAKQHGPGYTVRRVAGRKPSKAPGSMTRGLRKGQRWGRGA